jgi:putative membrane protein
MSFLVAAVSAAPVYAVAAARAASPMGWLIGLVVTTLVTAVAMFIISKLPIGVEIDSPQKAIIAALVFGLLNGLLGWLHAFLNWTFLLAPLNLVLNIIIFGLAAVLVEGFRLKNGVISAVLGSIALTIVISILQKVIEVVV